MASSCTEIGVIVNPRELYKECVWSFEKTGSVYSFFIRIIQDTFNGVHFKADLRAKGTIHLPPDANLAEEQEKLETGVAELLEKEKENFPDIFDLSEYLTRTLFHTTINPQNTLEFRLKA